MLKILKNITIFFKSFFYKQKKIGNLAYTLLEMSISISVLSLLAVGALSVIGKKNTSSNIKTTVEHIKIIEHAIKIHAKDKGYIPCPALANLLESNTNFGKSASNYNASTGTCTQNSLTRTNGTIPTRELGISDKYAYDGWGRKFTFLVSDYAASKDHFNGPNFKGQFEIVNLKGIPKTNKHSTPPYNDGATYVIISHGSNGEDVAWSKNNTSTPAGISSDSLEYENTNHNSDTIIIQDVRNKYFDDIVAFKTKEQIIKIRHFPAPFDIPKNICANANKILSDQSDVFGSFAHSSNKAIILKSAEYIDLACKKNKNFIFSPNHFEGLTLWLDASDHKRIYKDDSTCTTGSEPATSSLIGCWQDKSINGYNIIHGWAFVQPTYNSTGLNSKPALNFISGSDGQGDSIDIATGIEKFTAGKERTFFVVTQNSNPYQSDAAILTFNWNANPYVVSYGNYHPTDNNNIRPNRIRFRYSDGSSIYSVKNAYTENTPHILSFQNGKNTLQAWINGNEIVEKTYAANSAVDINHFNIGYGNTTITKPYNGFVSEVLVYDRLLTEKERDRINTYLSKKWDIDVDFESKTCGYGMHYIKSKENPDGGCACPEGEKFITTITNDADACLVNVESFGVCAKVGTKPTYATPPPANYMKLWLDANDCTTITMANNRVSGWADKSGNGFTISQPTSSLQPLYKGRSQNQLATLYFDGTDLMQSSGNIFNTQNHSIFVVAKVDSSNNTILSSGPGTTGDFIMSTSSDQFTGSYPTSATVATSSNDRKTNFAIYHQEVSNSFLKLRRNGALDARINLPSLPTYSSQDLFIGDTDAAGGNFTGNIAEIIIYEKILSSEEREQVYNYLTNKWDINNELAPENIEDGLKLWFDANDNENLFLDPSCTMGQEVTQEDSLVKCVKDKSISNIKLFQPSGDSVPSYKPYIINNKPGLSYPGGFISLSRNTPSSTNIQKDTSIFIVAKTNAVGTVNWQWLYLKGWGSTNTELNIRIRETVGDLIITTTNGGVYKEIIRSSSAVSTTKPQLYSFIKNGKNAKLYINSTLDAQVNDAVDLHNTTYAYSYSGYGYNGALSEQLIYDRALSDKEVTKIQKYLINKWQITD